MPLVIVPDSLSDAINKKLDAAYVGVPDAAVDREIHYQALLDHFYDYGVVPEFTLIRREGAGG